MKIYKYLTLLFLCTLIWSCGSNSGQKKSDFKIQTNAKNQKITIDKVLELSLENPKGHAIASVEYRLDGNVVTEKVNLESAKLGKHKIEATIVSNQEESTISRDITILNSTLPKVYSYKIVNEYPHDITSYTQGLEFHNGELYESTGQYGESKLRKVDYKSGEVLQNVDLANSYFGEGMTILNDKIYQLTWKSGTGFVYDVNTFEKTGSFKYGESKEGWGICNDSEKLYKSDGTEKLWLMHPETLVEEGYLQACTNSGVIIGLNELEWVNGKIYANRYQKNGVAIINPKNGAIEGVINFLPLKSKVTQHAGLDVLNGIAYNPETKTLFVTGKRWDKLFEVEIIEN
jgi:glutamine cyclotransferase